MGHQPEWRLKNRSTSVERRDKVLFYLAEVLKIAVQDLFPPRTPGNRIDDFIENWRQRGSDAAHGKFAIVDSAQLR